MGPKRYLDYSVENNFLHNPLPCWSYPLFSHIDISALIIASSCEYGGPVYPYKTITPYTRCLRSPERRRRSDRSLRRFQSLYGEGELKIFPQPELYDWETSSSDSIEIVIQNYLRSILQTILKDSFLFLIFVIWKKTTNLPFKLISQKSIVLRKQRSRNPALVISVERSTLN